MGKAVLIVLLAVVSSSAAAEWVEIGANESATAYADFATIEKAGNMVKMWDLLDFKAVQARPYGTPYMSQKTRQEYDCKEERARILDVLRYSENMGRGEVARADSDPDEWKSVRPGSTAAVLREFACGNR
jgi:predicted RNA-binding protein